MNTTQELCSAVARNAPGACVLDLGHVERGEHHRDAEGLTWRYDFKYGRPDVYEITWMSGHVETVLAHQIAYPDAGHGAASVQMHAELNGRWCLTLSARQEDIRTMRLVTDGERPPGGEPS